MKKNTLKFLIFSLIVSFVSICGHAFATDEEDEVGANEAKVIELKGTADYLSLGQLQWKPLEVGALLREGDKMRTLKDSSVIVETKGSAKTATMTVRKETEFTFKNFRHDEATKIDSTLLELEVGSVMIEAEKLVGASRFEVKTPTSVVGIRGTKFEVNVAKE